MENIEKQIMFKAIYSSNFKEKAWVEQVINRWQTGETEFSLTTSGSTGLPKSILLKKEILIWSANATKQSLNLDIERIFCCLPTTKTGGFMQIIRALYFGWEIYFENPSANPLASLYTSSCSLTSFTPMQLNTILEENTSKLSNFRNVLIGGAPISHRLQEKLAKWNAMHPQTTFWETYGMTETASHIALKNLSAGEKLFTPQYGVQIGQEDGKLAVHIASCNLFVNTNDLVELSGNRFSVLGRADNTINSGGQKIHPEMIEPKIKEILSGIGLNRNLYVVGQKDEKWGQRMVLVMEGTPMEDEAFVLELLKRELPIYSNPKVIIYTPNIMFTETGKLIRAEV